MTDPGIDDDALRAGHRARLRRRFLRAGPEALADYELLELLLFGAQPRGDVKPLAKRLILRFGCYAEVIAASVERLSAVDGLGEASIAALKIAQASAVKLLGDTLRSCPILSNTPALLAYCRAALARLPVEEVRVLYLDRKNRLIGDEAHGRGTVDHTPLYPREVFKRALELGASALIVVHNHPSGDPTPSSADIAATQQLRDAAAALGLVLHDHLIVARHGHVSLRERGLF
ncbi:MAG: DNA repair protein RadC [Alphaproteobacteria bacterium]|nr:DNA repair protein RadC [Alphaproteobacteria bacterium]